MMMRRNFGHLWVRWITLALLGVAAAGLTGPVARAQPQLCPPVCPAPPPLAAPEGYTSVLVAVYLFSVRCLGSV